MKFVLRVTLPVVLLVLAACGGSDATSPAKGSVVFKIDALTCTGTASIDLFIDGTQVGTETLSAGGSSKAYTATTGTHAVAARTTNATANSGRTWPTTTATVPANGTYTALLTCV